MEIALIHYAAPPFIGGVESVIDSHAHLMANDGHRVRIIAGRGEQIDPKILFTKLPLVDSRHEEILALKKDLDQGRIPKGFDSIVQKIKSQLIEIIGNTEWLIAHNVCSLNKNLALTAALKQISENRNKPKFILWHHDLAWTTPRYRDELHDGYPWDLLCTDWPQANQIVVSESRQIELAKLLNVSAKRISVVPNGIDAAKFWKLGVEGQEIYKRLDLIAADPLLLLPVRITPRKNIEFALKVLAELRKRFKNARLVVTGPLGSHNPTNAEYLNRLAELRRELNIEGAAYFLAELIERPVSNEVISDLYRLSDLLLFPSREEGFGIPILEAGLAGIPVFCADIAPFRELGGSQVTYFSLDIDPSDLAAQLIKSLESSSVFALRKRVLQNYSWEKIYSNKIDPLLKKG